MTAPGLSAVVPTLGLSPWLIRCLEALRRDGGEDLEILLVAQGDAGVAQGDAGVTEAERLADRVLRAPSNMGFAAANNLGLKEARGDYLATVNDDAIVGEGWSGALIEALEQRPEAAAAQGINVRLDDPETIDGAGLAWNRWWQAVQIGHGEASPGTGADGTSPGSVSSGSASTMPAATTEIFGVSATAAIYRRSALERLAGAGPDAFDDRLFAYYEDVDLACRLRGIGCRALLVPAATARHAGSASGDKLPGGKRRLIYRNRQLVLARLLGHAFWLRWPKVLLRDAADLGQALGRADAGAAAGIVTGVAGAVFRLPAFTRLGRPLVPLRELRRFRIEGANR